MRAGKLNQTITIERHAEVLDDYGVPRETWAPIATMKAEIVQASSDEFLSSAGQASETVIIFRTRFIEMTPADRVSSTTGQVFNVKELRPIGRRSGLEIRASA